MNEFFFFKERFSRHYLFAYFLLYLGTLDGGIGFVLPVPEKTFRRLHMVQNMLIHCMPHYAGLNPKAFR